MAIYHLSVKVISRATGRSAVAAAAYRSASRLHDDRLDRDHNFSNKPGVVHSEVLLPEDAPDEWHDRERLWNDVEAFEKRKDAQLSREVEFAIPRELDRTEGIRLARDFVEREFVTRGMIADLNVHWDIGADGEPKPHAHAMLCMREVTEEGFGAKVRDWNRTELLAHWRSAWADHANARLAELDIDARVDHRSLDAQGIDLEPQHKIGPAGARRLERGEDAERAADHARIARENGARIIAQPGIALDAITHYQATFTNRDIAKFVHRHSGGKEQFDRAIAAVKASPERIALGKDGRGDERFTSRTMIEIEARLERASNILSERACHGVSAATTKGALEAAENSGLALGDEQRAALDHVARPNDLAIVTGYAGAGKSAMLGIAREAWEHDGYHVVGAALSGIAAENLESGSGIASRTIASLEHQWAQGRELLSTNDILVIDEAGMIGSRQMERIISEAEKRGAKVVLVGDPEQLQAIEAGAAFRSLAERHGAIEITEIRRQNEDWQRDVTRQLATGRTDEAIRAYEEHGLVHAAGTREAARCELIERWDRERQIAPEASRIILTHTNDVVRALNIAAREKLRAGGELGDDVEITAERGKRSFAAGDRIMFLRNERGLGVKNGSLGTVQRVTPTRMTVMLDDGRVGAFDVTDYTAIDHGYAATIHKAQGVTVDRAHILATPGLDRHAAYVALSRHRTGVDLHYGRDDFADQRRLVHTLSRDRAKDMASDHVRSFADRRAIMMPETPTVQRSRTMFDGLKLPSGPLPDIDLPAVDAERPGSFRAQVATAARRHRLAQSELSDAIIRHSQIVRDMRTAHAAGKSYTSEQAAELAASRAALDALRPHGKLDLERAFAGDLRLVDDAAAGHTASTMKAMEAQTRWRTDPKFRADQFVSEWRHLLHCRERLGGWRHAEERDATDRRLAAMARSINKDPPMGSALAKRASQLGLSREWSLEWSPGSVEGGIGRELQRSRGIAQALSAMLGRELGLGR
jgi:Ti-type conjugative transfer relaxase TraA